MFLINRVAFSLMGLNVYWYGAIMALAVLSGIVLAVARERKYGFKKDTVLDLALLAIPAAVICARLYYVAFSWDTFRDNPLTIFNFRTGGMAIYGGILGGLLTGYFYTRTTKRSFWALADACAPGIVLGQAIGRWGNFFNQEAYGRAIESAGAQFFPIGVFIEASGRWHYATFFYESAWCLLVVLFLLIAERKKWFKRPGDVFLWYVLLYCLERMAVEGLRTDSLYWGGIRVSQLLSMVAALSVLIALLSRPGQQGKAGWFTAAICLVLAALPVVAYLPLWVLPIWVIVTAVVCTGYYRAANAGTTPITLNEGSERK